MQDPMNVKKKSNAFTGIPTPDRAATLQRLLHIIVTIVCNVK